MERIQMLRNDMLQPSSRKLVKEKRHYGAAPLPTHRLRCCVAQVVARFCERHVGQHASTQNATFVLRSRILIFIRSCIRPEQFIVDDTVLNNQRRSTGHWWRSCTPRLSLTLMLRAQKIGMWICHLSSHHKVDSD